MSYRRAALRARSVRRGRSLLASPPLQWWVGMVRVKGVQAGSVAEELGIVSGTELLTVNGRELTDFLNWGFLLPTVKWSSKPGCLAVRAAAIAANLPRAKAWVAD